MQELNIYGDVSGGWIFSEMDKFAHTQAVNSIGDSVTASASINYFTPLKQGEDFNLDFIHYDVIDKKKVFLSVEMETLTGVTIATASFLFIKRK